MKPALRAWSFPAAWPGSAGATPAAALTLLAPADRQVFPRLTATYTGREATWKGDGGIAVA